MRVFSILTTMLLLTPAVASAQNLPPPPTIISATADPNAHRHDGFYMRLATGFGSHYETINQEGHDPGVTVSGLSSVGEFAVGYAFRPGWIFGLGSYSGTLIATSRTLHTAEPKPPDDVMTKVEDFNIVGPFFDHYFDARGGLHLQGAIGIATIRDVASTRIDEDNVVQGGGLMLGFGYEWWVSAQWGIGVLGRVAVATTTSDDADGIRWEHGVSASPSILFTATYN